MPEGVPRYESPLPSGFSDEEFSLADESRRTTQVDVILPAYGLNTARRNHSHRRGRPPAGNRSDGCRARSRPRRLRLSHAALKQPDFDFIHATFMRSAHDDILHIRALRKLRLRPDQRRLPLPSVRKILYEDYEVRIADRDSRSDRAHPHRLDRQMAVHFRAAHIDFKLKGGALPAGEMARLQTGAGANDDFRFVLSRTDFGGHAACAIAGNFRLRTVGIDEARAHVGFRIGRKPFHAVGAHATMAIAQATSELAEVAGSVPSFHQQEIVAARRRLGKRNSRVRMGVQRRAHSSALIPGYSFVFGGPESRNRREGG